MACATGLVRFVVFLFNFLCWVVGLALIVLGSVSYVAIGKYEKVLEDHIFTPAIFIIVVGVIIFLISFFGCCGVVRSSQCMLTTYAVILLVLFVIQLAAGVYAYIKVKDPSEIKNEVSKQMDKEFSAYQPENDVAKMFDLLQKELHCCGEKGPNDYDGTKDLPQGPPESCKDSNGQFYKQGCTEALNDWIVKTIRVIGYVAMGISATELVCAMLALCLSSSIRNDFRRNR